MAYVYRHIRLDKNQPFYIGIGSDKSYKRAYENKPDRRNNIWNKIFNKTSIDVEIILDDLTWEDACKKEIEFISLYGRMNNGTGILCNLTDGGEGTFGIIVSKEQREYRSKLFSGKNNPMYGKKLSFESIEKSRQKRIGRPSWNKGKTGIYSKERLKEMSDFMLGKTAWNKGIPRTEEEKRKMSTSKLAKNIIPWNLGKKGVNGIGQAKIVLDLETGIYYESAKMASFAKNINHSTLKSKLNGSYKNNTSMIYV